MTLDPRTPVLVGAGQTGQRVDDPTAALEPIDLLVGAARDALADSGAGAALLAAVETVGVVETVSWHYPDPGALLARRLGAPDVRRTVTTTTGGNSPQLLLTTLAERVQRGGADVVLLGGAECVHTRWRARREPKVWLEWTAPDEPPCEDVVGDDRPGSNEYEMAHHAAAPTHVYPLLETAIRAAAGRSVEDHQRVVSELWARFAAVAAGNPHAWSRVPFTPEDIRTVSPENRMVTFPYPKRMCANIDVDQAAAIVLCSYDAARAAGVADDRLVFPLAGADAHDRWFVSERDRLDRSPAITTAAAALCRAAGIGLDDVARFDLYSCFPAAVEIAMDALGLPGAARGDARPLTVTGGLGFAGGPANDYPMHAIAAMVHECRADPGSTGYVGALGWYCSKHSLGLYSTRPPATGFVRVDPAATQAVVDTVPGRSIAGAHDGRATVEATAVVYERDGRPSVAIVSAITDTGTRALANTRDPDLMTAMTREPWEGRPVRLESRDDVNVVRP